MKSLTQKYYKVRKLAFIIQLKFQKTNLLWSLYPNNACKLPWWQNNIKLSSNIGIKNIFDVFFDTNVSCEQRKATIMDIYASKLFYTVTFLLLKMNPSSLEMPTAYIFVKPQNMLTHTFAIATLSSFSHTHYDYSADCHQTKPYLLFFVFACISMVSSFII